MKMGVFLEWNVTLPMFPFAAASLTTKELPILSSRIHRVSFVGQYYQLEA
jgi:hypothetical protein